MDMNCLMIRDRSYVISFEKKKKKNMESNSYFYVSKWVKIKSK